MRVLIHVAGEADLGVPSRRPEDPGWTVDARRRLVAQRVAGLAHSSPERATSLLRTLSFGDGQPHTGHDRSPLAIAQGRLAHHDRRGESPSTHLLVVGSALGSGVPTDGIAGALVDLACRGHLEGVQGAEALTVDSFDEDAIMAGLRERLNPGAAGTRLPADAELIVTWGSGAIRLALAILAGALSSQHRVSMLDTNPKHPLEAPALFGLDAQTDRDPLVSRLLALGFVGAALQQASRVHDPRLAEIRAEKQAIDAAVNGDPDDHVNLGKVAAAELSRLEPLSGMTIRAWATAYYRYLAREEGARDWVEAATTQRRRDGVRGPMLGEVIGVVRAAYQRDPSTANAWLLGEGEELNEVGERVHRLLPPTAEQLDLLTRLIDAATLPTPIGLRWPRRTVLAVAAVGIGGAPPHHKGIAQTILGNPPGETVLYALSAEKEPREETCAPAPQGQLLLLGSADLTLGHAEKLADGISADCVHEGWRTSSSARAVGYDNVTPAEAVRSAYRAVSVELGRTNPDAVVVVASGERSALAGALAAATRWSHDNGIPVLLRSYPEGSSSPQPPHDHEVLPAATADLLLLRTAAACVRRLELRSAARLLALGSAQLRELAVVAGGLGRELPRVDDHPVEHIRLCRDLMARVGAQVVELSRLLSAADAAVDSLRARGIVVASPGRPQPTDVRELDLSHCLGLLRVARNELTTHHGGGGANAAVAAASSSYRVFRGGRTERPTALHLLRRLVELLEELEMIGGTLGGSGFDTRVTDLLAAIEDLEHESSAAQVGIVAVGGMMEFPNLDQDAQGDDHEK